METTEQTEKNTRHGHSLKRIRKAVGKKQEALAIDLGISQQAVSFYEQKKVIEDDMLEKFAKVLDVPVDLIKEMEEDPLTIIVENNTFGDYGIGCSYVNEDNSTKTYNPIDKIIELSKEKTVLYERMLELEKEKNKMMEQILKGKK